MTQTPASTDGGQAPTSGSPQAGAPTTDGQAPVSQTTPTEHERVIERLRAENAAHRADLKKYKDEEAARAAAQMSELQKAQKQATDLQAQYDSVASELVKSYVRDAVDEVAPKFNFILSAKSLTKLLLQDGDAIEWDDDTGEPTNIEKLLDKLAKAEPDLVKKEAQQQQQGAPNLPAFGISGRSSIQPPDGRVPGRIPRISDPGMWKTN